MMDLECPNCKRLIRISHDSAPGQLVNCSMCNEFFILSSLNPPTLEKVFLGWVEPGGAEKHWKQKNNRAHPHHHEYDDEDDDLLESRKHAGRVKKRKNFSESD